MAPSLAKQGLVLQATDASGCKVFSQGDLILLCGRKLLPGCMADGLCAYQLCNLRPLIEAMESGNSPESVGVKLPGKFHCSAQGCKGTFHAELVSREEVARLRMAGFGKTPAGSTSSKGADNSSEQNNTEDQSGSFVDELPTESALMLMSAGTRINFDEGEDVLAEGTVGDSLFIVETGEVEVVKNIKHAAPVQLAILSPGECFGEMSLLSGEPCNATVRTSSPTTVISIAGEKLDELMSGNPVLHRAFSRLFMHRLKSTNVKLDEELERGMSGKLSMISILELVQTLLMARKTGTLLIERRGDTGILNFKQGQVRAAETEGIAGKEAFDVLARCRDGGFTFIPNKTDEEENIEVDTMHLLMEASRLMDEFAK